MSLYRETGNPEVGCGDKEPTEYRQQASRVEMETTAGQLTIIVIICKVGLGHPLGNDATAGAAGFPEAVTVRLSAGVGFLQEAGAYQTQCQPLLHVLLCGAGQQATHCADRGAHTVAVLCLGMHIGAHKCLLPGSLVSLWL